jgi:hypothetical protein
LQASQQSKLGGAASPDSRDHDNGRPSRLNAKLVARCRLTSCCSEAVRSEQIATIFGVDV